MVVELSLGRMLSRFRGETAREHHCRGVVRLLHGAALEPVAPLVRGEALLQVLTQAAMGVPLVALVSGWLRPSLARHPEAQDYRLAPDPLQDPGRARP